MAIVFIVLAVLHFAGYLTNPYVGLIVFVATPLLFVVGQHYGDGESSEPSGRVVTFPAPAPGAGRP